MCEKYNFNCDVFKQVILRYNNSCDKMIDEFNKTIFPQKFTLNNPF